MESFELKLARLSGEGDFDFEAKEESVNAADDIRLTAFLERRAMNLKPLAPALLKKCFPDPLLQAALGFLAHDALPQS
jgi:hypothetical protein